MSILKYIPQYCLIEEIGIGNLSIDSVTKDIPLEHKMKVCSIAALEVIHLWDAPEFVIEYHKNPDIEKSSHIREKQLRSCVVPRTRSQKEYKSYCASYYAASSGRVGECLHHASHALSLDTGIDQESIQRAYYDMILNKINREEAGRRWFITRWES